MSGFFEPQQVNVDPTPESIRPIRDIMAQAMFNRFSYGAPSYDWPGGYSGGPWQQLYGGMSPDSPLNPSGWDFNSMGPGNNTGNPIRPEVRPTFNPYSGSRWGFGGGYQPNYQAAFQHSWSPGPGQGEGDGDGEGPGIDDGKPPEERDDDDPNENGGVGGGPFGGYAGILGGYQDPNFFGYMDLPAWGGPYAAPLTGMQMDAMAGMSQLYNPSPITTIPQMQQALTGALTGSPAWSPQAGVPLSEYTKQYDLGSSADSFFQNLFGGGGGGYGQPYMQPYGGLLGQRLQERAQQPQPQFQPQSQAPAQAQAQTQTPQTQTQMQTQSPPAQQSAGQPATASQPGGFTPPPPGNDLMAMFTNPEIFARASSGSQDDGTTRTAEDILAGYNPVNPEATGFGGVDFFDLSESNIDPRFARHNQYASGGAQDQFADHIRSLIETQNVRAASGADPISPFGVDTRSENPNTDYDQFSPKDAAWYMQRADELGGGLQSDYNRWAASMLEAGNKDVGTNVFANWLRQHPDFKAEGGQLDPSRPTVVGEEGPEMILGDTIIPNEQLPMLIDLLNNEDLQFAAGGGTFQVPGSDPYESLIRGVSPHAASAFVTSLSAPRFDLTSTHQNARETFQSDLDNVMARAKEEMSAYGLNPGSSERTKHLTKAGGEVASRFNLGMNQIENQAFENAEGRRIGAMNALPAMTNLGNLGYSRQLSALPYLMQREQQPFENMMRIQEPAATRQMQALGMMPTFYDLPFSTSERMYRMGDQARGVADTSIARMMQEYARTQGGQFNQLMSLLSGSPLTSTGFGPSYATQIGNIGSSIAQLIPFL